MKPAAAREHLRGQSAELPELGDHVGLIGVSHVDCDTSPIHFRATAGISESGLKAREPHPQYRFQTIDAAGLVRI